MVWLFLVTEKVDRREKRVWPVLVCNIFYLETRKWCTLEIHFSFEANSLLIFSSAVELIAGQNQKENVASNFCADMKCPWGTVSAGLTSPKPTHFALEPIPNSVLQKVKRGEVGVCVTSAGAFRWLCREKERGREVHPSAAVLLSEAGGAQGLS